MNIESYSALGQLFGCYFHQDWPEEFESGDNVIHYIVVNESRDKILAGVGELDQLLALKLSEENYRDIMTSKIGCFFEPESEGLTYVEWLLKVRVAFSRV